MNTKEYLERLSDGVEKWNTWRERTFDSVRPNLDGCDLSKFDDLTGVDSRQVSLRKANLSGTVFDKSLFDGADLTGAEVLDEARRRVDPAPKLLVVS